MTAAAQNPEFSRPIAAADVGLDPVVVILHAEPSECAALARRFGLQGIDSLVVRARYHRVSARDGSGPVVRVEIDLDANVTQLSVVDLEPIEARVEDGGLITEFALEGAADIGLGTVDIGPDDIDPPEHLTDGRFDLGELAAEYLALSLDPYPRAGETDSESSALSEFAPGNADEEEKPFAVLRDWRKKSDGESGGESG